MGLLPHRGPLQSEWLRICRMQLRARLIAKHLARHCQDNTLLACRLRATKVLSIFITPRTDGGRSSRTTTGSQCTMGIPSTIVGHAGQDHRQSIVPAQNVLEMQLLAEKNGRPSGSLRLWEDSRRRAKCSEWQTERKVGQREIAEADTGDAETWERHAENKRKTDNRTAANAANAIPTLIYSHTTLPPFTFCCSVVILFLWLTQVWFLVCNLFYDSTSYW